MAAYKKYLISYERSEEIGDGQVILSNRIKTLAKQPCLWYIIVVVVLMVIRFKIKR